MGHNYEDRIRRVLSYIYDNPAGDLSLDAISDVAAMSRFHWHRVFHAMTGETCAEAVRRVRAFRAASLLQQSELTLEQIAAQTGFNSRQSFARNFQDQFGMTPAVFRKDGRPQEISVLLRKGLWTMFDVEIRRSPARTLVGQPHTGNYFGIGRVFDQVSSVFASRNLWAQSRGMAAIYYDDPAAVAEADLRSFAGIILADGAETPDGLDRVALAEGDCAVLRFQGPYSGLKAAYDYLYGEWLPGSGREPADAPPFEIYQNSPLDTAPEDLVTDICAPLKASD